MVRGPHNTGHGAGLWEAGNGKESPLPRPPALRAASPAFLSSPQSLTTWKGSPSPPLPSLHAPRLPLPLHVTSRAGTSFPYLSCPQSLDQGWAHCVPSIHICPITDDIFPVLGCTVAPGCMGAGGGRSRCPDPAKDLRTVGRTSVPGGTPGDSEDAPRAPWPLGPPGAQPYTGRMRWGGRQPAGSCRRALGCCKNYCKPGGKKRQNVIVSWFWRP